ncbi:MAG: hypothetical protein Q8L73_10395 [Methylotenera sp.]|nr:hypothetical protein [Methylotenera sp.]
MAIDDFTLSDNLRSEIEGMDCVSQKNNDTISYIAQAISRLTDDKVILGLVSHIDSLAQDNLNEVNVMAERLGANFKGVNHG